MRHFQYETTDSTNERALAAIARGDAEHMDVHTADAQTGGRGRRGSAWVSEAGAGLYLSLIWCPPRLLSGAALTVAAGLGTLDAIRAVGLATASLEWPNDVVCRGAKIAGVLVETRGLDQTHPAYVVGVGINVAAQSFPDWLEAERAVSSLRLEGVEVEVSAVEAAVLEALPARLEQITNAPGSLADDFVRAGSFEGRVTATLGEESLTGELLGLDLERGVTLALEGGGERVVPLERIRGLVSG